jgi:Holliday junction resolvase RusA-like endonuclease
MVARDHSESGKVTGGANSSSSGMHRAVWTITIPIKPVPFSRPRFKGKRCFNDPKYQCYRDSVALFMKSEAVRFRIPIIDSALRVQVVFLTNLHKTTDLDNLLKAIMDCGNGVLWKDDRLIYDARATKLPAKKEFMTVLSWETGDPTFVSFSREE